MQKFRLFLILCSGLILLLSACTGEESATEEFDRSPSLRPSETVLPFVPTEPPNEFIGRNDPTQAALAAEGQPSEEANVIALPTEIAVPFQIFTSDGILLNLQYYRTSSPNAPLIILLHAENEDGATWSAFARQLQNRGYHVAVPDLRGSGSSSGQFTASALPADVIAIVQNIFQARTISPDVPVGMVGVGAGGNAGLVACSQLAQCRVMVIVSPRESSTDLDTFTATQAMSNRSLLIISADNDALATGQAEQLNSIHTGDHLWQRFSSGGSGGELFSTQPQLGAQIEQWLVERIVPPLP